MPFALKTAHRSLLSVLDREIKHYKAHLSAVNRNAVIRSIEHFVDVLEGIPGGREELRRRAESVQQLCGAGSDYETSRAKALQRYRSKPKKLSGAKLTLDSLRTSKGIPVHLKQVAAERRDLGRLLDDGDLNLPETARQSFKAWAAACRKVQRSLQQLEVDGCWYLFHIHEAAEEQPSQNAIMAKSITMMGMGGANLTDIRSAANSLVAWVAESPASAPPVARNSSAKFRVLFGSPEPTRPMKRFAELYAQGVNRKKIEIARQIVSEGRIASNPRTLVSQFNALLKKPHRLQIEPIE